MSLTGRNTMRGSTVTVYRAPTVGADTVTWGSAALTAVKLELIPVTDEIARDVFGAGVAVTTMAMTGLDIRLADGVVVTAGTYAGTRFRVTAALPYTQFAQLALHAVTEVFP